MKTRNRLVAVILIFCLAFTFVNVAGAEPCYEEIKEVISTAIKMLNENAVLDSTEIYVPLDLEEKLVLLMYNLDDEDITLIGVNEYGNGETYNWNNLDILTGITIMSAICEDWKYYEDLLEDGYTLTVGAISYENDIEFGVASAEEAAKFVNDWKAKLEE